MYRLVAIVLVLCAAIPAQAAVLRPFSLRELAYRADSVVVAMPINSGAAGEFKVTRVLRGNRAKVDATITLTPEERRFYSLAMFGEADALDDPERMPVEALLFLNAPAGPGKERTLVPSGLLIETAGGNVLAPRQQDNSGAFVMTSQEERLWSTIVMDTTTTAAALDEVIRLKAVVGRERTPGLLRWIERHRNEFGGGFYDGDRIGWGSLETDVFDWICAQGQPTDCWAAARLYAELNHGAALPLKGPYFATVTGRKLLLRIALDERMLNGERSRALTLLCQAKTLTPAVQKERPDVTASSAADLASLAQKVLPLTETNSEGLRTAALTALRALVVLPGTRTPVQAELKAALPQLEKAYKSEKPGVCRDLLVELIYTVAGAERWKEIGGNKTGVAVLLRDLNRTNEQVNFWLQVLPLSEKIYERPTLVLERLDAKDKVVETKTLPLPVVNTPRWEEGWTPADLLLVQLPTATFNAIVPNRDQRGFKGGPVVPGQAIGPAVWRVSVRGTVGKEKKPWTSEPKLFHNVPAPNPGSPGEIDIKF